MFQVYHYIMGCIKDKLLLFIKINFGFPILGNIIYINTYSIVKSVYILYSIKLLNLFYYALIRFIILCMVIYDKCAVPIL